ncbi:MAG: CDP-alcohol phosphatidyltransferase family protein [Saprospiraceae bacterium]|nr:CDP-alcohol phosphatidyltransferase family protein [Saprospiraceae bacterium]
MGSDWKNKGQALVYKWIDPLIRLSIRVGIAPNFVTLLGLLINIFAAAIFIYGAEYGIRANHSIVGWAGATILLAGLMDMIDGRLARIGKMETTYGALFDSVLDRYSEMFMFLGICYYLIAHHYFLSSLFAFIAMIGSVMVSYTRARAEGLGLKMADVGFMQRPERILLIGISGVVCGIMSEILGSDFKMMVSWLPFPLMETISFFTFPIFALAIFANITAITRLFRAGKMLENH